MAKNRCASCGKGEIQFQNIKDFKTNVRGVPFTLPEARVGVCSSCGARFYSPTEIRRWQQLVDAQQVSTGRLLGPEEIEDIRQALGLSINSFAALLGSTRQSVYNWERKDRKGPQLRLVDLLLRLIRESTTNGTVNVLQFLSEQSGLRLVLTERSHQCLSARRSRRRDSRRRWRDPSEYDRAVGSSGPAVALPSLRSY
jgi:putative zinc finger/helix-turn-helix YgiT family protein